MVEFKDKKIIYAQNVDAENGSFALDKSPLKFETCRERFGRAWDETTDGWFFKHPPRKSVDVASFVLKTEAILKQSQFSKFSETNRDTVLWVEPSPFWKACRMRRSLLTILIRAGMVYDLKNDNYEHALFNQQYVTPTKRAVKRFLHGFTKYTGPSIAEGTLETTGWVRIFEGKDIEYIKTILVWPEETLYKPTYQREDVLWF